MPHSSIEVLQSVLANATNLDELKKLVTDDVTYVSLNHENAELRRVLPWAGTGHGPQHIVDTFLAVHKYWEVQAFDVKEIFGSDENVAVFGTVTIKSRSIGKSISTPFSILAKFTDGKVSHMQFLEDSFGTASTFRTEGVWHVQVDAGAAEIEVGA